MRDFKIEFFERFGFSRQDKDAQRRTEPWDEPGATHNTTVGGVDSFQVPPVSLHSLSTTCSGDRELERLRVYSLQTDWSSTRVAIYIY
jgi:hypothetical protein